MWCCPNCGRELLLERASESQLRNRKCEGCEYCFVEKDRLIYFAPELSDSTEGFDPIFFEQLERIEESNFWFVNRASLIIALLARYFPEAKSFLEVGCGTGSVLLALRRSVPSLHLSGSELHAPGLKIARRRLDDVLLLQMNARKIPARSEFDVIGMFDVLEHIVEDTEVLEQVHSALKPGGGLLVSVPQHPWLWSQNDDAAHHVRRYCRGELEHKLSNARFRIIRSTSFTSVLLPLMIASRFAQRLRPRNNPMAELEVSGWLNRALSSMLRLEVELTKRGLDWPVGGSRMIVAQRL